MEKIKNKMKRKCYNIILLAPLALMMSICFVYSIIYGVMGSLGFNKIVGIDEFTFEFYKKLIQTSEFKDSFIYTLKLTFISSLASALISVLILYFIYSNINLKFINNEFFKKVVEIPLLVPYIIGTYMILALLSQRGILSQFVFKIGFINNHEEFPVLTNDKHGVGMICTYIWKSSAFIVAMSVGTLFKVEKKWRDLKKILNISEGQFFRTVVFNILAPGLITSYIIVFTYIFTSFETPYILGVTYPKTLSLYAYELCIHGGLESRGVLMALNVLITFASVGLGGISYFLASKWIKKDIVGWD
ncbi:MAG: hypothetical protein ACRCUA_03580 [Fusobacteriaceae bacterium]